MKMFKCTSLVFLSLIMAFVSNTAHAEFNCANPEDIRLKLSFPAEYEIQTTVDAAFGDKQRCTFFLNLKQERWDCYRQVSIRLSNLIAFEPSDQLLSFAKSMEELDAWWGWARSELKFVITQQGNSIVESYVIQQGKKLDQEKSGQWFYKLSKAIVPKVDFCQAASLDDFEFRDYILERAN